MSALRLAGQATAATEEDQVRNGAPERTGEQSSTPDQPAAEASLVDVTFSRAAEGQADSVALCGDFNQWSVEDIQLERGNDGVWRAVIALERGRSYRYRYLIDGERWENASDADQYVPNPFGSVDSVIIVGPTPELVRDIAATHGTLLGAWTARRQWRIPRSPSCVRHSYYRSLSA